MTISNHMEEVLYKISSLLREKQSINSALKEQRTLLKQVCNHSQVAESKSGIFNSRIRICEICGTVERENAIGNFSQLTTQYVRRVCRGEMKGLIESVNT